MTFHLPLHLTCKTGEVSSFAFEKGGHHDGVPMLNLSVGIKIQVPVTDLVNALAGFQETVNTNHPTSVAKAPAKAVVEQKQPSEPQSSFTNSQQPPPVAPTPPENPQGLTLTPLTTPGLVVLPKAVVPPAPNTNPSQDWLYPVANLQSLASEYTAKNSFATLDGGMAGRPVLNGSHLSDIQSIKFRPPVRKQRTYENQGEEAELDPMPGQSAVPSRASSHHGSHAGAKSGVGVLAHAQPAPKKQPATHPSGKVVQPKPVPVPPREL